MNTNIMWKKLSQHLIPNVGTIVVVALMLFSYNAWAAPNAQTTTTAFPYQGTLTYASGNPVNTNVDITFRLYDVSTSGTALWEEAHTGVNAVPVADGLFQVMLGSLVPITNAMWESGTLYLGIQIGNDPEMTPREVVGNVPGAVRANFALTVPEGSITQAHAPRLIQGPEDNVKVLFGEIKLTITEETDRVAQQLVFDEDFSSKPKILLQPYNNFSPAVTVTLGSPCDGHSCGIRILRVDGNTWAPGEYVTVQWVAIGK